MRKTLKINNFFKRFADKCLDIILLRIGFWSNGMYHFLGSGSEVSLSNTFVSSKRKWLVVVGREFYFESVRDYPIGHSGDLKKLLRHETWRYPYRGVLFLRIKRLSEHSHRVTSWVVKSEVLAALGGRPFWILPESVCVEAISDGAITVLQRLGQSLKVAVLPNGLTSGLDHDTSTSNHLGSGWGGTQYPGRSIANLEGSAAVESILLGVFASLKVSPLQFFVGFDKAKIASYSWVTGLKLAICLSVVYLASVSFYLLAANGWVEYRLDRAAQQSESSLMIRSDLRRYRGLLDGVNSSVSGVYPMWVAWDVLLDLTEIGVSFRAVNSTPPAVTYYMTADRATDVMSWLSQDPRVATADFALQVRRVGQSEQFAIKATFNEVQGSSAPEFIKDE